jgi:hypothetical protein
MKKNEIAQEYINKLIQNDEVPHKTSDSHKTRDLLFFLIFKHEDSLELTAHGCHLMTAIHQPYTFITTVRRSGEILLRLDQVLDVPYYITDGKIVLFDETQAAILTLHDDLKSFLGI